VNKDTLITGISVKDQIRMARKILKEKVIPRYKNKKRKNPV